ncbi:MAG TPA: hypothetical protein VL793_02830 [Patescibacteria group bacterium]|nr:hypothetical protein [Patescibacteria group bacterium]
MFLERDTGEQLIDILKNMNSPVNVTGERAHRPPFVGRLMHSRFTPLLLLTCTGFAVGFFMSQLDIAARRNELLLQELNFIHTPAFRIANVVGLVHQVPGIQWLKFDISCGIIIEWTLVGLLAGMIQNLWAWHRSRGAAWPVKGS